jgi:hypothetical protein
MLVSYEARRSARAPCGPVTLVALWYVAAVPNFPKTVVKRHPAVPRVLRPRATWGCSMDDRRMGSFIPSMPFATLPAKDGRWRRR